ncbi:MAG: DUF4338 domain-containing protein [Desulfobacteraceae bacterium]|nr:MAG: DUF4338 domain-containing protein [Desulfobacteraceae bacterium]
MTGSICDYEKPVIHAVRGSDAYLWDFLIHHYHYLGLPTLVGKYLKQIVTISGQPVACLGWASAAMRVRPPAAQKKNLFKLSIKKQLSFSKS